MMTSDVYDEVQPNPFDDVIERLWAMPPDRDRLARTPAFQGLLDRYIGTYTQAGSRQTLEFALREAIRRLGLGGLSAVAWQDASARLHRAAIATVSHRLHLTPLDWAGEIPPLNFGPNAVLGFTKEELRALIEGASASPIDATQGLDLAALAQFRWLVVRETVPIAEDPGSRMLPGLFDFSRDFGRIEPYRRRLPIAVERGLACLLAIPWEDLTRESSPDWRPFQVPWTYTIDDDLFSRRPSPPDPASLTWDLRFYDHGGGEPEEFEVPLEIRLDDDSDDSATRWINNEAWARFEAAEASALLTGPVLHFFLAGLQADGIDEFLAHVVTVEAALGQASDHGRHPPLPDGRSGATARTAWRLGRLLDDDTAAETFRGLFKLRSRYIHGEGMDAIPSTDRTSARRLARRCVCALVSVASSEKPPGDRAALLQSLIAPKG